VAAPVWTLLGGRDLTPAPVLVAGIVNVTPDSFFDGGLHAAPAAAAAHAAKLLREGADIIDIGGESTRPGSRAVDAAEECARIVPVVRETSVRLRADGSPAVVAIDTYRAETAYAAVEHGAAMVNDISAARFDPEMVHMLADMRPGYVLMHAKGTPGTMQLDPRYGDVVAEIMAFFEERLGALVKAGLPEERIALDPGIGFGKTLEHNLEIFRNIERFASFGRPLYMGLSNKSWLDKLLCLPVGERGTATQVATALLAARGVHIHRVHDVAATVKTLKLVAAMAKPGVGEEEKRP